MARLVCALLLLTVAAASASESRIIGGSPAAIEDFASVAQLQRTILGSIWRQHCAASILTARYLLTSALCLAGPTISVRNYRAIAGTGTRNDDIGGQVSGLARIIQHDTWHEGINRDGDIAIAQLQYPLQYTNAVQQATILAQGAFIPDNMPATQVGFGLKYGNDFPTIFSDLSKLSVYTVNNQRCAENYANLLSVPMTVTSNMVCASSLGDSGACIGDRGGPLIISDITVGIISWGWGCSNSTFPTVHTAIPSYTNWITQNVN